MGHIFPNSMEKLRDDATGDGVDIIMRTKDRPALLSRALQSVINQKHANWHIYLINDGGQLAPVSHLLEIFKAALADRVTIIHNETSLGMAAAANAGLSRGYSDFVAIHDDDDSWDPHFLLRGTSFLTARENRRYGGFLSKWHSIEENFDGQNVELLSATVNGYDSEIVDFLDVLRKPEIPPIALMWRRSVCKEVGYFNEHLPVLDDWDLNLRILQVADIGISTEVLANHHVRRQSAGTYSNSITQGLPTHFRYNAMYRNSLMRAYLSRNPEQIGLVAGLLRNAESIRRNLGDFAMASHQQLAAGQAQINSRLDGIEAELKGVKSLLEDVRSLLRTNGSATGPE